MTPMALHMGGIVTSTGVWLCMCDRRRWRAQLRRRAALAGPCQDVKLSLSCHAR